MLMLLPSVLRALVANKGKLVQNWELFWLQLQPNAGIYIKKNTLKAAAAKLSLAKSKKISEKGPTRTVIRQSAKPFNKKQKHLFPEPHLDWPSLKS